MYKPTNSTFGPLDEIRGLAALAVFFVHYVQLYYETDELGKMGVIIKSLGVWGVSIFFILSGFLIHISALKEFANTNELSWRSYMIRRFFRIYPPYLLCLIVSYICGLYFQSNMITKGSIGNFLAHIFMVSTYFPHYFETINSVFWTVIVEVHFYLIYPIIWYLLKKYSILKIFVTSFIIGIAYFVISSKFVNVGPIRIMHQHTSVALIWKWVLGVVIAEIYWMHKNNAFIVFFKLPGIFAISILFTLIPEILFNKNIVLQYERFILPLINFVFFGSIVFGKLNQKKNRYLQWVGKVSYSLYLWHPLSLLIIINIFKNETFFSFIMAFLFSLIFSWLSYHFIEKFSSNVGKAISAGLTSKNLQIVSRV